MTDAAWEQRLGGLATEHVDGDGVVHVARAFGERRRGLAKMTPMPHGHALRILKCNSVHTFGMRFALDLVWLGRGGRVVRVDHDVAPRRISSAYAPARSSRRERARAIASPLPRLGPGGYTGQC